MTALVILVVAGAACAETAPGPTTHPPAATAMTTELGLDRDGLLNADEILSQAEGRIGEPAHEDARCFFSILPHRTGLAPIVRCGPEQGRMRAWLGAWHTHALDATLSAEGARLELGADLLPGWDLLPGEQLWRPDGALPASADDSRFIPVDTAFDRLAVRDAHPIVVGFASDFQTCMAERGILVFGLRFLYDGAPYVTAETAIADVEHVGSDVIDFGFIAPRDEMPTNQACLEESAETWGVTLLTS